MIPSVKSKLHSHKGLTRLTWVLIAIVVVLVIVVLIPVFDLIKEQGNTKGDSRYEQAAYDSASLEYLAEGKEFHVVYDSENKTMVELAQGHKVKPYGQARDHKYKVILIDCDKAGEIKLTWVEPTSLRILTFY